MRYRIIQKKLYKLMHEIKIHNKYIIKKITVPHEHEYSQKLLATSLYLSIIDLTENITILLSSKKPIAIPGLVRDCIDAYINLLNVMKKYDFFLRGEKQSLKGKMDEIRKAQMKDLTSLSKKELTILASLLQQYTHSFNALKNVTPKYIYQSEKRRGIDLQEHIDKFYEIFSSHTHNDATSLAQRHIILKNGQYKASTATTLDKQIINVSLSVLLDVIGHAVLLFSQFIGFSGNHNIENIISELKKCKGKAEPKLLN